MSDTASTGPRRGLLLAAAVVTALYAVPPAQACALVSRMDSFAGGDVLRVDREEGSCVFTVLHRRGIGAASLAMQAPVRGVRLRFEGFAELESLVVSFGAAKLLCDLQRAEAVAAARRCSLNGASVPAMRRVAEGFELTVPPELALAPGDRLEVHWTDFWR